MEKGTRITELTDHKLSQRAGKGDMVAFEEVYNRHHQRVYALCLRMLKSTSDAEDLTHDVFMQLHRKIGSFRGESAFTTWLHRLTVNQVLMYFRKNRVHIEQFNEQLNVVSEWKLLCNTNPASNDTRIDIRKAVKNLAPGYQSVFILHDVEGFEHNEVARILGISDGTSKSQLHKARLKLRKMLKQKTTQKAFAFA